jgi:hypothetical protein
MQASAENTSSSSSSSSSAVPISNALLLRGLLPDTYFIAVKPQLEGWLTECAQQLDAWLSNIVTAVMDEITKDSSISSTTITTAATSSGASGAVSPRSEVTSKGSSISGSSVVPLPAIPLTAAIK